MSATMLRLASATVLFISCLCCQAETITGFEELRGFHKVAQNSYVYKDESSGTTWLGRVAKSGTDGTRYLEMYAPAPKEEGVYWYMLSHLKGEEDVFKSVVVRQEVDSCAFRSKATLILYFKDYLGRGGVDLGKRSAATLGEWAPINKGDVLYDAMVIDCAAKYKR